MNKILQLLTYIWWAPSWWMTRLVIWRDPKSSWTRTTDLLYMVACATPTFKLVNAALWFIILIETTFLYRLCNLYL